MSSPRSLPAGWFSPNNTSPLNLALSLFAMAFLVSCDRKDAIAVLKQPHAVTPWAQCSWQYHNGLEPFKNSYITPGFDFHFNPHITISRRGLTARVVGVLSDETLERFGGSLESVLRAYPYLTPIHYTAVHRVVAENIDRDAAYRLAHPGGQVIETQLIELPANAVMIIYPVSIAAPGMNTAAGNWSILSKDRARPSTDDVEQFGRFPFLKYTTQGHALHGPITGDREHNAWVLLRGRVSHGCNRMEGEHIVELSVLLNCPATGRGRACSPANERVTVMEEFDHFPDPLAEDISAGVQSDLAVIAERWVTPELPAYPRDATAPLSPDLVLAPGWRVLEMRENKLWGHYVQGISEALALRPDVGAVRVRNFSVWDNRDTVNTKRQYVEGISCEG